MANGQQKSTFQGLLDEWQGQASIYISESEKLGTRYQELQGILEKAKVEYEKPQLPESPTAPLVGWAPWEKWGLEQILKKTTLMGVSEVKQELTTIVLDMNKNNFYASIYTIVPQNLMNAKAITEAGGVPNPDVFFSSTEDVFKELIPPSGMTAVELDDAKAIVEGMFEAVRSGDLPITDAEEIPPELAELLPPLEAPTGGVAVPLSLQAMTVDELLKTIAMPSKPAPILPEEEWQELFNQLYPEYADMSYVEAMEAQAREILAESKLYNEQMGEVTKAIAEMPDYKLTDFLKEMVVMPGVALLEVARKYFEVTSQPMAAGLYKIFIPDIENLYQQHRATSDSDWQALQKAWEEWDAPGSGVPEFLLKYMVMESITDPLTWLSIFTMGTSMIASTTGKFGRFATILNKATRVIFAPFEAPFTGIKWVVGKIPKTVTQRATIAAGAGGKAAKVALERFAGDGKLVTKGMTMKDWKRIADRSIRYAFDNPQTTDELAQFGRALLQHNPLNQKDIAKWSSRLGLHLTEEQVTREMVINANTVFEAMFQKYGSKTGKLMTTSEAGSRLLEILGLSGGEAKLQKQAVELLSRRANSIVSEARAFARLDIPAKALRQLVARNFRYSVNTITQQEWLKQTTRIQSFVAGMESKVTAIWGKYVEKLVIRPMAESYLAFGMYGPMNVLEDYWRSILGGVFPRRMTVERFAGISKGLAVDASLLDPSLGVSESIGRLSRRGAEEEWNNWVLQLAAVGQKEWADKLYTGLVRLPGGFGMDLRRNFVGQKYLVLFKEMGGEKFEAIVRAEGRLPQLSDRMLVRELRQAVIDAKSTLDLDAIKAVKNTFTRRSIYRKEVNSILKEHPDLPNNVRDYLIRSFDEETLFVDGAKSINSTINKANNMLVEEYLRGAELATKQFQQLTDELVKLEVKNPEEVAHLMVNLNIASQVYGATPKQIMAQATIRSRGLPLAERRAHFDKIYDDILMFMDKAGGNLEQLLSKLRADVGAHNFGQEFADRSQRLFDLIQSKRQLADTFRAENMAWRRETFAGAERKGMTSDWWDDFYRNLDSQYHDFNIQMMRIDGDIARTIQSVDMAAGIQPFSRPAIKVINRELAPQDVAQLVGCRGDDLSRALMDNLTIVNDRDGFVEYIMAMVRPGDEGFSREAIGKVYDQIAYSLRVKPETMSWITSKQLEMKAVREDLHYLYHSKLLPDNEVAEIGRYVDETADIVERLAFEKGTVDKKVVTKLKPDYEGLQELRQQAMDEANKWYYKEYTDYTNANAFDSIMKAIYPFWRYESQRWFWLPRSFIRHPGTFTAFERWQDNTDYGYIPIAGSSIEINPFRGTIYGTLSTRLSRRDYPEYYDAYEGASGLLEFNDFLSRWGFYPGAHIGIPLALFGGAETQMGEIIPAVWKSPLMVAQAAAPDNKFIEFITDHIFGERFRNYLIMREVTAKGYDASVINAKRKAGEPLTDEEQAVWEEARRPVAAYSLLFEQAGLLRLKHPEQRELYKAISQYIEEKYGYAEDQQKWLRLHGYKIWDMIGGMSPDDQMFLEELEYWKWQTLASTLYPGRQQAVADKLTLDWDEIERYVDNQRSQILELEKEALTGGLSPRDYADRVSALYAERRAFMEQKEAENELLTLEARRKYYEEQGIPVPVLHPLKELMNLYFSIEVREVRDPETGELLNDWDTYWAERAALENAIPDQWKAEWTAFISRHQSPLEEIRHEVNEQYISKYNQVWQKVLSTQSEEEQRLIKEFLYLERMNQDFARQEELKNVTRADGRKLVSAFRSDVSEARKALRYANPYLDAWLFFWGRVSSFQTPEAEQAYKVIARSVGKKE